MDKIAVLKEKLSNQLYEILTKDELKITINSFVKDELTSLIYSKKEEIFKAETYNFVKKSLKSEILKVVKSQNFKEDINIFIDKQFKTVESSNKKLGDILPPALINSIKVYIFNHKDNLIDTLKKFVASESVDNKISEEISKILNSFNPMVSRFISSSNIQTKLIASINEYLDNPDNIINIINLINNQLDGLSKKKISEFTEYFPSEGRKSIINSAASGVINNVLSESFIDLTISKVEEKFKQEISALNENSTGLSVNLSNLIDSFTDNYYPDLLNSEKGKKVLDSLSSNAVDNILQKRLMDFIV